MAQRVLAIDTSTWWGGIALVERSGSAAVTTVVAEIGLGVQDSHASRVLVWIDWLLLQAGWTTADIDAFVALRGPGSFTGIRVGLGTVQGLTLAAERPCLGVGTLEAMAEDHGPAGAERLPVIPAGRGEIYCARYDPDGSPPVELQAPRVGPALELLAGASAVVIPRTSAGPSEALPGLPAGFSLGRTARAVAAAAGRLALLRGLAQDEMPPAPLYLRHPDARPRTSR